MITRSDRGPFGQAEIEELMDEVDRLRLRLIDVTAERDRWISRMQRLEHRLECIRQAIDGRMDP